MGPQITQLSDDFLDQVRQYLRGSMESNQPWEPWYGMPRHMRPMQNDPRLPLQAPRELEMESAKESFNDNSNMPNNALIDYLVNYLTEPNPVTITPEIVEMLLQEMGME